MEDAAYIPEQEELLTGGNTAELVVRLGSTVRKPATPSTPAVHSFLAHLRSVGFDAAPEAFGLDEQGRQILEFVPGSLWQDSRTHSRTDLRRVGAIIRDLHQAASSFQAPEGAHWSKHYKQNEHEIVCHNDLAPWNLVCGPGRLVFIDWDAAAPATRTWDLAWTSISFPPFEPECDLKTAATAMRAILDGYGFDRSGYGNLIRTMVTRARAEYNLIVAGAKKNQQPWSRLYFENHHRYWGPVAAYIKRNATDIEKLLTS